MLNLENENSDHSNVLHLSFHHHSRAYDEVGGEGVRHLLDPHDEGQLGPTVSTDYDALRRLDYQQYEKSEIIIGAWSAEVVVHGCSLIFL